MSSKYEALLATAIDDQPVSYTDGDAMLYALGVGFCSAPDNVKELPYAYEAPALKTVPTFASMLPPSDFLAESGLQVAKILLGGLRLELYRPLPAAAELLLNRRVLGVYDRGVAHGAMIVVQSEARLKKDDTALFTLNSTLVARGDGGIGGSKGTLPERHLLPKRDPDLSCSSITRPDQALLFRLSGDRNPLHADPAVAREAGFARPLLHGRCTYGIACRAILNTICDYDHTLITGFDARFSAPVYPGDTLVTDMWQDRNIVSFRCSVKARNSIVLSNGKCTLAA
ncbi:MAG TPA: MaoC/PaaZ C-terminal domain-containing protein [Woeseiaceae bacterium]|nr:MaoC/PaaZ C-terminal domain-containing protein [Woeseiaceae bacterium]